MRAAGTTTAATTGRHKLFATWKNQVSLAQSLTLAAAAVEAAVRTEGLFELSVCPSMTALASVARVCAVTAQNMGWDDSRSLTGETSATDLADLGCRYVILGQPSWVRQACRRAAGHPRWAERGEMWSRRLLPAPGEPVRLLNSEARITMRSGQHRGAGSDPRTPAHLAVGIVSGPCCITRGCGGRLTVPVIERPMVQQVSAHRAHVVPQLLPVGA